MEFLDYTLIISFYKTISYSLDKASYLQNYNGKTKHLLSTIKYAVMHFHILFNYTSHILGASLIKDIMKFLEPLSMSVSANNANHHPECLTAFHINYYSCYLAIGW